MYPQKRLFFRVGLLSLLLLVLVIVPPLAAQDAPAVALPALADLEAGQWHVIETGGETLCARGTPYNFQVRPAADPDADLLIHFQGGGACWSGLLCREGSSVFRDRPLEGALGRGTGIFDVENPQNPFSDFTYVLVSYCTGDVHTGINDVEYTSNDTPFTLHHRGAINANAVLDWVFANVEGPQTIMVTGSSAGAYGAIHHAPTIMDAYPDSRVVILGDAGVGAIPEGWDVLQTWGLFDSLPPDFAETFDPATFVINDMYLTYGEAYPDNMFAQYTTTADSVQIAFFFSMGEMRPWWGVAEPLLDELEAEMDNFASYVIGGDLHTIVGQPEFYTYEVEGVPVREWVTSLLATNDTGSVRCTVCDSPEPEPGE